MIVDATFWQKAEKDAVSCFLCPHHCKIPPGGRGLCGVRENQDGQLIAINYGQVSGLALDPVEKKPLYHFCPGSLVLSVGSVGCNLDCGFCQNYQSVAGQWPTRELAPEQLIELALAAREQGSCGIAWTYTEPVMWYEYVRDSALLAREAKLKTILVTNGYLERKPWRQLLEHIDAVNIDLKAFDDKFYRRHCRGSLAPVLANIEAAAELCHVEVTTLLIEGYNTDEKQLTALFKTLAKINPDIPLHLSRYYPARNWTQPATEPRLVLERVELARNWLHHVYPGNLPLSSPEETRCPQCNHLLVTRLPLRTNLRQGRCPKCGRRAYIQLNEE